MTGALSPLMDGVPVTVTRCPYPRTEGGNAHTPIKFVGVASPLPFPLRGSLPAFTRHENLRRSNSGFGQEQQYFLAHP